MAAMRPGIHPVVPPSELGEFAEELKRMFVELGRTFGRESLASECSPAVDVFETDESCEIRMDLPAVEASAIRIVIKGTSVLLAGEKASRRARGNSSFHLVERGFGITREIGDQLLGGGIDVMTSGNHIWDRKEAVDYIGAESRLLRPANFPAGVPGHGSYVARTADGRSVGIINIMGRVFMANID